jgi:hypothetical protein
VTFQKTFTSTSAKELDTQVKEFFKINPDFSIICTAISTHQITDVISGKPSPLTQYTIVYTLSDKKS